MASSDTAIESVGREERRGLMAARGRYRRRSSVEWSIRILVALAVAVGGYVMVAHSLAFSAEGKLEKQAYALAPHDGRIAAAYARSLIAPEADADAAQVDAAQQEQANQLARAALRRDATAVDAVITLGLTAQMRRDTAGARLFFTYADRLSRRELQTQLWTIVDAAKRENIREVLRQYDIALRTSNKAPDLLFPALATAIADLKVRSTLVDRLGRDPLWKASFLNYAATKAPDKQATAMLFAGLKRSGQPVSDSANVALINSLTADGDWAMAWTYYASTHPGAARQESRDPRFTTQSEARSQFDWKPYSSDGIATSISRGDRAGVFTFSAAPSVGGTLLRQTQVLPPGHYTLQGHSARIDQSSSSQPYWKLTCRHGAEIGRITVPNSDRNDGLFAGHFDVPTDCPIQDLTLVARPSDKISGAEGEIRDVLLHRAG